MNAIPAGYVETKKGVYERTDIAAKRRLQNTRTQQPVQHEPLAKIEDQEGDSKRLLVRIESVRKFFLDTDGLYGGSKFYIDFLRYCGAIRQDTEKDIELKITQRKPKKGEAEKTIIEVWKRSQ
jgi:hypothetical protein